MAKRKQTFDSAQTYPVEFSKRRGIYKAGETYKIDGALAHHYVVVEESARVVKAMPDEPGDNDVEPKSINTDNGPGGK